jgi:glycosyltransferase involved in cell wall biosynthesis
MLGECRAIYTNAKNTAARLAKFNALRAEPLYHPPRLAPRLTSGAYGDYILSVGRIESVKRVDLIAGAMVHVDPGVRLLIAGDGTQRENVERFVHARGVADRVTFLGAVGDDDLVGLYREALAVVYPPFDEDFGYVTLEAFLARKPVITCSDSGGPNEFVVHGENGFVCDPTAEALALAVNRLHSDRGLAARMGDAGHTVASAVTWDGVIEKLVESVRMQPDRT